MPAMCVAGGSFIFSVYLERWQQDLTETLKTETGVNTAHAYVAYLLHRCGTLCLDVFVLVDVVRAVGGY
eukprot:4950317-Pleurochrysis_carterae.AAC.1